MKNTTGREAINHLNDMARRMNTLLQGNLNLWPLVEHDPYIVMAAKRSLLALIGTAFCCAIFWSGFHMAKGIYTLPTVPAVQQNPAMKFSPAEIELLKENLGRELKGWPKKHRDQLAAN